MARGDVVNQLASVAAAAYLAVQPALGEEYLITEVGSEDWVGTTPNKTPNVSARLYDGTNPSTICLFGEVNQGKPLKIFINNSVYLSIYNHAAAAQHLSYCGIQTK